MSVLDSIMNNLDYETFLKIIYEIPSCIFFKDTNLRYVFCTKHWEQQNTPDIIGKIDLEIRKDRENAILATESDKNILKTGKGCSYIIKTDIEGGSLSYFELVKEPIFDNGKVIGIVGLINNITEKVLFDQKLKELNATDSLTKLYNRRAGVEIVEKLLAEHCADRAFMLVDLNKFKHINDTYGHQVGDSVLREFGVAIKRSLYEDDVAMRLGGDEFIIFLSNVTSEIQVRGFLNKLCDNIKNMKISDLDEEVTASIGVTLVKDDVTFDTLYRMTDEMMYEAKQSGDAYVISDAD